MTNLWANSRSMALVNNPGYLPLSGSMNAPSSTEDRLPRDPDPIARERQAYVTASRAQLPRGQYILDQSLGEYGPRMHWMDPVTESSGMPNAGAMQRQTCASPSV